MSPRFSIRPPAILPDRRLAELAASGDDRAFEALIRRHRRELERYCRRMGLAEDRAEDVLQQSFTRAWLALRDGGVVGQPRPWLYRIVHNAALNAHRSARLRNHEPLGTAAVSGALLRPAVESVENGVRAREALRAVAELPRMQREAVVMTAIEGRSHHEAAGMLGVSDGAVRGLVHRARTRLRAAAAVMSPQGIAALLSRGPADGVVEAGAGAGFGGILAKGAAVAAVSGLAAGGAAIHLEHRHAARRDTAPHASAVAAATAPSLARGAATVAPAVPPAVLLERGRPSRAARPGSSFSHHRHERSSHRDGAAPERSGSGRGHPEDAPTLLAESPTPAREGPLQTSEDRRSTSGGSGEATREGSDRHGGPSRTGSSTVQVAQETALVDGTRDGGGSDGSTSSHDGGETTTQIEPQAERNSR